MSDLSNFRRRSRPGWGRPSANEPAPIKRLRGLDEFVTPDFVGRMARIEQRRRWAWFAMLVGAVAAGAAIGLLLF